MILPVSAVDSDVMQTYWWDARDHEALICHHATHELRVGRSLHQRMDEWY